VRIRWDIRNGVASVITAGLVVLCSASAAAQELVVERDLKVPMPDGALLMTDVYRPAGEDPLPVVFVRTPYVKDQFDWFGQALATHGGYAVVIQDMRGQVASEGEFQPFANGEVTDSPPWTGSSSSRGVTATSACGDPPTSRTPRFSSPPRSTRLSRPWSISRGGETRIRWAPRAA